MNVVICVDFLRIKVRVDELGQEALKDQSIKAHISGLTVYGRGTRSQRLDT